MPSIWLLIALAVALAAAAAWVLVVGWRDEERRARVAGLRPPPESPEPAERERG